MLPPFCKLLLPSLVVPDDGRSDVHEVTVGFVEDLAQLMNRLGDVHVVPLAHDPQYPRARRQPLSAPLDEEAVERMLVAEQADGVIVGNALVLSDALMGSVTLLGPGSETRWSEPLELIDGMVREARLVLAANLIEAATGRRKDVRRARIGGTHSLPAYLELCRAHYYAQAPRRRIRALEAALRIDPHYSDAKCMLADSLLEAGHGQRADELLSEVVEAAPRYAWARQRLGVVRKLAGDMTGAVEAVQGALDSDPDGMTLYHAGLFAEAGGDVSTALALYERAVERGSIDPVLCENLGRLQANAGNHEMAIALWDRARSLDSDYDHLLGNLALAHHHCRRDEEAAELFDEAVLLSPTSFTTHANRAVFLQDLGRHDDAVKACTRALALRPASALMRNNRGVSRLALGDQEGARVDFEEALRLEPQGELASFIRANIARLSRGSARVDEALRLLEQGAKLARQQQHRKAVPLLLEALDLYPESWEAWMFLALAYREQLKWDQAADALAQVLRLAPGNADAHSERALSLLALGRPEEAREHALRAVKLSGGAARYQANLGLVELEAGELQSAQRAFDAAEQSDPADPVVQRCLKELKKRRRKDPHWGRREYP